LAKKYVESTNGKLRIFQLPGYSPELNSDEWIWENLKKHLGKHAYKNLEDLANHATIVMNKIKNNTELIRSFYNHVYN